MNLYVTAEQIGLPGYWITDILQGITKEALKKNITVVDYNGQKPILTEEYTRPLALAIGYSYHWMESTCQQMQRQGVEPLLVNAGADLASAIGDIAGFVGFDIAKTMRRMVHYSLANKRKRIAFFGAHDETHSDQVKMEEFLALCRQYGLTSGLNDVYKDFTLSDCVKSFELNRHLYNAVICSSDAAAVYLLRWCKEHEVSVPEELFIIGFGDSIASRAVRPTLTTVQKDFEELGRQAVKLHQFLQRNRDIRSANILVDCPLVVRESTAEIPYKKRFPKLPSGKLPLYDADPDVLMVLQIEELLRMWDEIDRSIVRGLLENKTIISIAEGLFISVSAVKYRIKKMLTAASLQNKEELVSVVRYYSVL